MSCVGSLYASSAGTAFTYQGQLNSAGTPANGTYDFRFSVFDQPIQGSQQGAAATNAGVTVSNGTFTTAIDFGAMPWTGDARWLEIAVRGGAADFVTLSPRQLLSPVPYAMQAAGISGVLPIANGGLGFAAQPTAIGQFLRSTGTGVWGVGALQSSDVPNLSGSYVDLASDQLIAGAKTFKSPISAAGFIGDGGALTNLSASQFVSGTLPLQGIANTNSIIPYFVTPYQFGAKGDGITDDTIALQNWINFAASNQVVALVPPAGPPGSGNGFLITSALYLTNAAYGSFVMRGIGYNSYSKYVPQMTRARILLHGSTGSAFVIVTPGSYAHIEVSDVYFFSDTLANTNQYGISITCSGNNGTVNNMLLNHVGIYGFDVGLYIQKVADSVIERCAIWGNNTGIWIGGRDGIPYSSYAESVKLLAVAGQANRLGGLVVAPPFARVNLDVDSCNFGQGGSPGFRAITIGGGQVALRNVHSIPGANAQPEVTITNGATVTIENSQFGILGTAAHYPVVVTNASATLLNTSLETSMGGFALLEAQSDGTHRVSSFPVLSEYYSGDGGSTFAPQLTTMGASVFSGSVVATNFVAYGTNAWYAPTNTLGLSAVGQLPVSVNGVTYFIDLKQ